MDHYVNIDMRPDPEFPVSQLMNALYAKLHRALAALNSKRIGVSFPGADTKAPHVGSRLRLHGSVDDLSVLLASDWLAGMRDHVTLTSPAAVPDNVGYRNVRRVQVKSNADRLRRRLMRRHDIDENEARQQIPDEMVRFCGLPYIQLRSNGNSQSFKLFIEQRPIQSMAEFGEFNAYGLSQGATVPWF